LNTTNYFLELDSCPDQVDQSGYSTYANMKETAWKPEGHGHIDHFPSGCEKSMCGKTATFSKALKCAILILRTFLSNPTLNLALPRNGSPDSCRIRLLYT